MTDTNPYLPARIASGESRRSFLKKSAVATVGVGAAASSVASAQDADGVVGEQQWKALIFQNNFHPEARFAFVSGVVTWTPDYGDIDDSWFANYNMRMIRWLNTGEHVQLFVANDAEIGEYEEDLGFVTDDGERSQPQVYEVSPEWSLFEDSPKLATINFGPADEEAEDRILESDDWWRDRRDEAATDANDGDSATGNTTAGN